MTVAVASTFSPRFLPMLVQARAIATLLDQSLEIIHAGPATPDNHDRFSQAFAQLGFSAPIHWQQASLPSTAIIDAVRAAGITLLVAGAMERDIEGRFFLGKVARVLVREAPCSLLLYANPGLEPIPFRTIAVIVDYTEPSRHALRAALDLAARSHADTVHVLRVFTVFAQVLAEPHQFVKGHDSHAISDEEARLDAFVQQFDIDAIPIITRCIEGTTGFAAADYVQSIEADLLVVAADLEPGHPHFPARMEWLENVIPSNLLLIHPAAPGDSPLPPPATR